MKRKFVFFMTAAALMAACSSDNGEEPVTNKQQVTLTFTPYDVSPMTRTSTSISSIVTHLDVWITDGTTTTDLHQSSGDSEFGSLSVSLDRNKTYTLYAVGHKCTGDATLIDGVVAFPDDKVTHSIYYTTSFSPTTTASLSCEMQRIVGNFRVEMTDDVPDAVTRMVIHIGESPTRWNVTTGGCNPIARSATYNITTKKDIILSTFIIAQDDAVTNYTMTVTAYDANDQAVQQRTFADVPIRNGYKTTYRGAFFTNAAAFTSSFTVNDWNEYETVTF